MEGAPPRPGERLVAVLDACVLVPGALRDLLLSCADAAQFRPVWQDEILDEMTRNASRLLVERSAMPAADAQVAARRAREQMGRAFPGGCVEASQWEPLVGPMTNDVKDQHVLAVAVAAGAHLVVSDNLKDFPVPSWPPGVEVLDADAFLGLLLDRDAGGVVRAIGAMSRRATRPPMTPREIGERFAAGASAPKFGARLLELLDAGSGA